MLHVALVVATHVICGASVIFVTQFAKVGAVAGSLPTVSQEHTHTCAYVCSEDYINRQQTGSTWCKESYTTTMQSKLKTTKKQNTNQRKSKIVDNVPNHGGSPVAAHSHKHTSA